MSCARIAHASALITAIKLVSPRLGTTLHSTSPFFHLGCFNMAPLCGGERRSPSISHRSVMGVPIALEVGNERRADVAIGLIARIGRAIAAEQVERLLPDPQGAAIAD